MTLSTAARRIAGVFLMMSVAIVHAGPLNRLPKVIDANGKTIGGLFDVLHNGSGRGLVLRRENGTMLFVGVSQDGTGTLTLVPSQNGTIDLLHATSDCSGEPFIAANALLGEVITQTIALTDAGTGQPSSIFVYATSLRQSMTIQSFESYVADCAGSGGTLAPSGYCCLPLAPQLINVVSFQRFDISSFTMPLRLR